MKKLDITKGTCLHNTEAIGYPSLHRGLYSARGFMTGILEVADIGDAEQVKMVRSRRDIVRLRVHVKLIIIKSSQL